MTEKKIHAVQPGNSAPMHTAAVSGWKKFLLFWPAAMGGAALDLWSKWAVFRWLGTAEGYRYSIIDGFLQFVLRENEGAAFSLFQGWTAFLIIISAAALIFVTALFFCAKFTSKLVLFSMGFITAGIIGNLYDRLFNEGRVRDFIDVYIGPYHWPTFNAADSMLCIGVGLLIISNFTSPADQKRDLPQTEGH